MTRPLSGKVALITGAARGVGRSFATRLAEQGADLVLLDLCGELGSVTYSLSGDDELDQTVSVAREFGAHVLIGRGDVRDTSFLEDAVSRTDERFGRLDIVCANAGIASMAPIEEVTDDMWDAVISVNLTGAFKTARAAIPLMRRAGLGGSIIFTSSTAAVMGSTHLAHYCASKHGVTGLMRVLAHELAPDNIRVNALLPTSINTAMIHNPATYAEFAPGADPSSITAEDVGAKMQKRNLLAVPWVEPDDVANAMLWLVGDGARMITGVQLPVDAGKTVP